MANRAGRWIALVACALMVVSFLPLSSFAGAGHAALPAGSKAPSAVTAPSLGTRPSVASNPPASPSWASAAASPLSAVHLIPLGVGRPLTGGSPVNFSRAAAALATAAGGFASHSWSVGASIGEAPASPAEFPLSRIIAGCTVSWFSGPVVQIYVPTTPSSAPIGSINAWFAILVNVSDPGTVVLGDVINGTANLVVAVSAGSGCNLGTGFSPLPPNLLDSPQAATLADAAGGTSFLARYPGASLEFEISPGNPTPGWLFALTSGCGAVFEAGINALSGSVFGTFESDTCEYAVTFTETGLATGTSWSVNLNGSFNGSSSTSISVNATNGSQPFTVSAPGYIATPASGTVVVAGAPVTEPIVFSVGAGEVSVNFTVSGLAPGAFWSATMVGPAYRSTYTNLSWAIFVVPNGNYSFYVDASGYNATPASGSINVSGPLTEPIVFTPYTFYTVSFDASGLPLGSFWQVEINATGGPHFYQSSNTAVAVVSVPNGSYTYSITSYTTGWVASPSTGSVLVAGANASVPVTFVVLPNYFIVTFSETGLAAGAMWQVTDNVSGLAVSNGSTAALIVTNGTFSFDVLPVFGYASNVTAVTVTITGGNQTIYVAFAPAAMYLVTFSETGLPAGAFWNLTVGTFSGNLGGASTAFYAANGTLAFTASALIPGFLATPSSGNLTVNGGAASQTIVFSPITHFDVTFSEVGLPTNTSWNVTLNGSEGGTNSTNVTFPVVNGSYGWVVGAVAGFIANPDSGSVTVSGLPILVTINFTAVPSNASVITFVASGLPVGASWVLNVTVNGTNLTTAYFVGGAQIALPLANGTYNTTAVPTNPIYHGPGLLVLTVTGLNRTVNETFVLVTFAVNVTEQGLPSGTPWWVNVSGHTGQAVPSANNTTLFLANGSYTFTLASANKSYAAAGGGFSVNGTEDNVTVTFRLVDFPVTFTQTGLPGGTEWWVNITGGASNHTTGSSMIAFLSNGTFLYTVATANKSYAASGGGVAVFGTSVSKSVTFALVVYAVDFTETGLPPTTPWWVNISGEPSISSTGSAGSINLPNGSYTYTVASQDKSYMAVGGSVTVNGATASKTLAFSLVTYTVTFTESNLPAGTSWSVTLGATTLSSTTTTIVFTDPNGTYAFTVGSVSGYSPNATSGSVHVNGGNTARTLDFSANPAASSSFLGLPGNDGYYLLGALLLLVIVAGTLVAMRSRRKGAPPPPNPNPTAPAEGSSPPTGDGPSPPGKTN